MTSPESVQKAVVGDTAEQRTAEQQTEDMPSESQEANTPASTPSLPQSGQTSSSAQPGGEEASADGSNAAPETSKRPEFRAPEPKRGMMPPPSKKLVPAVPKFNTGSQVEGSATVSEPMRAAEDNRARSAALAAKTAAMHATPAQREKAIAEAAAAAAAAAYTASKIQDGGSEPSTSAAAAKDAAANLARVPPSYVEPEWGGLPDQGGLQFSLETMKGGQIISRTDLDKKSHYTFGRTPACDMVLEHPSISRLHAVIQFRAADGQPLLFDAGSVHGSFLNKRRVKPRVHAPLSVGDILKFGQSSRMFILGGPAELMPEEGLSRPQRQHLAALEAKEKRKEREREVAKAQMAAALNHGISWGMGEDAREEYEEGENGGAPSVDWRAYAQTHSLTDHQQKLADKLRRTENRIRNLTTEAERIRAKQTSMEDLTAGQAAQLARNEQVIDKAEEEFEDLEELLNDSIAESLRGKKHKMEAEATKKRRKKAGDDEDSASSDEDEFYDRTAPGKAKKRKAAPVVHDAASLFGRKEALLEERKQMQRTLDQELVGEAGKAVNGAAQAPAAADPLDAFMSDVAVQLEQSKVDKLRRSIADLDAEVAGLEKLLKQADPDNYYKEGTHAARVAREKGLRLYNQDKERQAVLEKRKRQQAAAKAADEAAAKLFVPETEEEVPPPVMADAAVAADKRTGEEAQAKEQGTVHRLEAQDGQQMAGGLQLRTPSAGPPKPPATAALAPSQQQQQQPPAPAGAPEQPARQTGATAKQKRDAMIKAALVKEKDKATAAANGAAPPSGEDAVLADLALLRSAARTGREETGEGLDRVVIEETAWQPPVDQSGDGKTSLNEKLGY